MQNVGDIWHSLEIRLESNPLWVLSNFYVHEKVIHFKFENANKNLGKFYGFNFPM